MRFVFIHAHARIFHITTMCRVLQVSRAGCCKWRAQPLDERVKADGMLAARIHALHMGRRRVYGSPRVHQELRALRQAGRPPMYASTAENSDVVLHRPRKPDGF